MIYPKHNILSNPLDEAYNRSWSIIQEEYTRLINLSTERGERGDVCGSHNATRAAILLSSLATITQLIANYIERVGQCRMEDVRTKFHTDCIEESLQCLSHKYGVNLQTIWYDLLQEHGIDLYYECPTTCCLGIGEMVIEEFDECIGFIIEPCNPTINAEPPYGEFNYCEFNTQDFTRAITNENCNE